MRIIIRKVPREKLIFFVLLIGVIAFICFMTQYRNFIPAASRYEQAVKAIESGLERKTSQNELRGILAMMPAENAQQCIFSECDLLFQAFSYINEVPASYFFMERMVLLATSEAEVIRVRSLIPQFFERQQNDTLTVGFRRVLIRSNFLQRNQTFFKELESHSSENVRENVKALFNEATLL